MKKRFDAYEKTLYDFLDEIYVVCPNCKKQALVKTSGILLDKEGIGS